MQTEVEMQRTAQYKLGTKFWINYREKTNCHPNLNRSHLRLSNEPEIVMLKALHCGTYRRNVAHVKNLQSNGNFKCDYVADSMGDANTQERADSL